MDGRMDAEGAQARHPAPPPQTHIWGSSLFSAAPLCRGGDRPDTAGAWGAWVGLPLNGHEMEGLEGAPGQAGPKGEAA